MHLAYSAFREVNHPSGAKSDQHNTGQPHNSKHQKKLRYLGYQAACHKYRHELAAIREYLPHWQPQF